jgi:uncharacterized protein YjeT (DUF2065 family)
MFSANDSDPRTEEILLVEQRRCRAIVERDFDTLRGIVASDLVHTHTRGNTQNYDEYFEYIEKRMIFRSVERQDLKLRFFGNTAVVTGKLTNVVRPVELPEFVSVEAQVLQVWVKSPTGWRQMAYQATALGPPVKVP